MSDILDIQPSGTLGPFKCGRLGYGCWRFAGSDLSSARVKVDAALSIGVTLFDTAAIYGFGSHSFGDAEARLGAVFQADPELRDKVTVVTKGGIYPPMPYDSRAETLIQSCEGSLSRLNTDVVDLFLVHRPDLLTSWAEVAKALTTLRESGKIKEAGVSNFTPGQIRGLQAHLDFDLVATQPEFSALHSEPLEDGTLDIAQEFSMAVMAWSPLGGGRLVSGAQPEVGTVEARVLPVLREIADRNDCGVDHVALAWVLAHPSNVFALIGTQSPERIKASAKAYDVKMSRRDWYAVLEAARGARMP